MVVISMAARFKADKTETAQNKIALFIIKQTPFWVVKLTL